MSDGSAMMLILGTCVALTVAAGARSWRVPLRVSLLVALSLRVLVAVIASGHTPTDVQSWFHSTAVLVSHHHDPITSMARYRWNFLPTLPYAWSILLHVQRSWEATDKALAIAADCVNVVLVAALAANRKRNRAFQYAVSPLALLVVSWHGQIEPIVLACALTALVFLRRGRYTVAGTCVGLAAAMKTWPIIFALALFRGAPRHRRVAVLAGIAAVPFAVFVTMPLFLSSDLVTDAGNILGYGSRVGAFGWTGLFNFVAAEQRIGNRGGILSVESRISTLLLVVAAVVVFRVWRQARPEVFMLALLLSFLVTSAGFGVQYLLWPLPLAIACATRRTWLFIWPATVYAFLFYLPPFFVRVTDTRAFALCSIPVVIGAVLALPIDQRVRVPARAVRRVPEPTAEVPAVTADALVAL